MKKLLLKFPVYFAGYLLGFLLGILSDITLTSLFLGCVALGLAVSPLIAVAVFFLTHVGIQMVNAHGSATTRIATEIARTRRAQHGPLS